MTSNTKDIYKRTMKEINTTSKREPLTRYIDMKGEALWNIVGPSLIKIPAFLELVTTTSAKNQFIADIPAGCQALIKKGILEFSRDKKGELLAQIKKNGHFYKNLRLHKEHLTPDLLNAVNNLIIQMQLRHIIDLIGHVQATVDRILEGQYNDRYALCLSAEQQLLNSELISNREIKQFMVMNAIQTVEESRHMVMLALKNDLDYICGLKFGIWSGPKDKDVQERLLTIANSVRVLHRASMVEATGYYELKEYKAMATSLDYYLKFIKISFPEPKRLLLCSNQGENKIMDWVKDIQRLEDQLSPLILTIEDQTTIATINKEKYA